MMILMILMMLIDDVDDDGELVRGGKRVTTRKLRLTIHEGMYREKMK